MNILDQVRPSDEERARVTAIVQALQDRTQEALAAHEIPGEVTVQGSIAKDTWLAGARDIDLFILYPPDTDADQIAKWTVQVAKEVLDGPKQRYAQHPYVVGRFGDVAVDMVPAYRVGSAADHMSAVDRTPFHTAWVLEHLGDLRDDVRLAKRWCRGVGVYGAETSIGGFSGYLIEVLIHHFDGFDGFIDWLVAGGPRHVSGEGDAPLVVLDPVDEGRNCAAAVTEETMHRAQAAAAAFRKTPEPRFFFPDPPTTAPGSELQAALEAQGATWLGLEVPEAADRLDIVYPQFQKAAGRLGDAMQKAGFRLLRQATHTDDTFVGLQWVLDAAPLPATREHHGPPADTEHAERFRAKWQDHPDAPDGVQERDGRLFVEVHERHREPRAWIEAHWQMPLGKHVDAARPRFRLLDDPADVLPVWSPAVTDFVLDRAPWQR